MAYRFDTGQSIPQEVRRVFFEEVDSAVKQLTIRGNKNRDESIHEARKSIKKLRGLLRLIAPLIGKQTYRKENQVLGDIGRKLSQLRDARAIIEIFETVVKEAEAQTTLDNDLLQSIRGCLEEHKSETEQKLNVEGTLGEAVAALQAVRGHVDHYQLTDSGFEGLERGLKNVYRRGRQAMKQAVKTPAADHFHDWRKRVKDHWYHMRLLGALNTAFVDMREDDLKKLETWLGDDHNVAVLRDTINSDDARFGHPKQVRPFLALMKQHGEELREKALDLGGHLYGLKPKRLVREFEIAREVWPAESDAVAKGASQQFHQEKPQSTPVRTANGNSGGKPPRKKAASVSAPRSRAKAQA